MRNVSFVVLLAASTAIAKVPPEAKRHEEAAKADYNLGSFQAAIDEWSTAYRLYPDPVYLFDVAQAHRRLGHASDAIFFYHRYLDTAPPDGEWRKASQEKIAELEELLKQQQTSRTSPPPGTASSAELVSPPTTTTPAEKAPTAPTPPIEKAPAAPTVSPPTPSPPIAPAPSSRRTIGVAMLIGGAAVAAVGAAMLIAAPFVYVQADNANNLVDYDSLHTTGRDLRIAGAVIAAVGAVAAATGIALMVVSRRERTAHVWIAPAAGGFAIGGGF